MLNGGVEKFNPSKKTENSLTKEQALNIDEVFKDNPRMALIFNNNKESFRRYLGDIFPDSKIKDVVYHGTNNEFDTFKKGINGIHFTKDIEIAKTKFGPISDWVQERLGINKKNKTIAAVLNVKNFKEDEDTFRFKDDIPAGTTFEEEQTRFEKKYKDLRFDAVTYKNKFEGGSEDSILVFDPKQIHILGSEQDILQAKDWLKNKQQ